jgi:hypothetical protein
MFDCSNDSSEQSEGPSFRVLTGSATIKAVE